ncbi:MAG TPA: hypothetical protein VFF06_23625 [Polyangia bacterium]|nr:hypothetical protein [Polyangia bacterium]
MTRARRAPVPAALALALTAALGLALALSLGGCGGDGLVDLTIALDPAVPDATVAQIRSLTMDVTGLETTTVSDPLAAPFAANREERVVVRSPAGGAVTLAITARDGSGAPLAFGQVSFTLQPGAELHERVTLSTVLPMADGGADSAGADLGGGDLAAGADLLAPVDLAGADLAPIPCPANVLLCEGFETGTVDALRWDSINPASNGTIALDNTRAHRGQWSLHAHLNPIATGATGEAEIGETHTFAPVGQTFYVRAFYYFPSAAQSTVATIIDTGQVSAPFYSVSLAIDHDAASIYDAFAAGAYDVSTAPKIPLDAWVCLEFTVDTGTPNTVRASVNGVNALTLNEATTGTPGIGQLQIGLAMYSPNTSAIAVDAWIDDIIVDKAPIGCAK